MNNLNKHINLSIILALISIFCTFNTYSQQRQQKNSTQGVGSISGVVIDENTNERIEYSNILLLRNSDSSMITGTITNKKGEFVFSNLATGRYLLKVQFIGYENKFLNKVAVTNQIPNNVLGNIYIRPKQSTLSGVEITAEKALITSNLDKKIVKVDKDMALSGGTAADVMSNVPSVSVDAEGNVSLRGNQNITLLIDGKPASQAGISSSDILNQLPASSIESVEVITNPSVRYDPDGTSGIINIVLKKKSLQGFNGQVSGTYGFNNRYNGSLNLNYRHNKFNFFSSIDARYNKTQSTSESVRTSNIINTLRQSSTGTRNHNSLNYNLGVDYFLNTRNSITLSAQHRNMEFGGNTDMTYRNFIHGDTLLRYFDRYSNSSRNVKSYGITASYKHLFAQSGREFTQDFIINSNQMRNNQRNNQQDFDVLSIEPIGNEQRQFNQSNNDNNLFVAQGNYTHPYTNGGRLETGYKASIRDMKMNYDYNIFNYVSNSWDYIPLLSNQFDFTEQIYAIYGIYGNSWKKFKYQAGMRFEYAFTDSYVKQTNKTITSNYPGFYPSLHTSYELSKNKELQLSYSRRVDRPSPRNLNPFVDYSDSLNLRTGNPSLDPEMMNSLELGYQQFIGKGSYSITAFFRNTNNGIQNISVLDANGVTTSKPENISKSGAAGLELITGFNPLKWWRVNANMSFFRSWLSEVPQYHIEGVESFSWSARLNTSFNYSKTGSIQVIANYMSPTNRVQVRNEGNFSTDISARQDFWDNKLTLTARLTDVFNTQKFNSKVTGTNFITENVSKFESRIFYLGMQLRINNYKKKVNTTNIDNDNDMDL